MTKSELVQTVSRRVPFKREETAQVMQAVWEEITAALSRGERVTVGGFGSFSVLQRRARRGRHPRTGKVIEIDEKAIAKFRASTLLRERLTTDPGGQQAL